MADRHVAETSFTIDGPLEVPPLTMQKLPLREAGELDENVRCVGGELHFATVGWYEVLLRVEWDPHRTDGSRFCHSKIPDQQPLHSEAINAAVLTKISDGKQLLRGNTVFGPRHMSSLVLECWHDSGAPVRVLNADLTVRELRVPWSA